MTGDDLRALRKAAQLTQARIAEAMAREAQRAAQRRVTCGAKTPKRTPPSDDRHTGGGACQSPQHTDPGPAAFPRFLCKHSFSNWSKIKLMRAHARPHPASAIAALGKVAGGSSVTP